MSLKFAIIPINSSFTNAAYDIKSKIKNKYYIGKSVDLNRRKIRHYSELRTNSHFNIKLQRHYLKYGESDLEWGILKEIHIDSNNRENIKIELGELEKKYITEYDSYHNGFNFTKGGDGLKGCGRKFSLQNKNTNVIKKFNSFAEAADFIGCSSVSSVHALISKKCNSCKGWYRVNDIRESHTGKYSVKFTLYHDLHGTYTGNNISEFRRKFNVNSDISSLIKGKLKTCSGWRTTP